MASSALTVRLRQAALRWLAQREHSRSELRERLVRHQARPNRPARRDMLDESTGHLIGAHNGSLFGEPGQLCDADIGSGRGADEDSPTPAALAEAVEGVLDWLVSRGYLNEARFVESRVHARMAQWGQRRIQHELQQHGLALDAQTTDALRQSELQRALALWQRRFAGSQDDPKDKLRQMRFLAGRGFSAEVIRRVVSGAEPCDPA